MRFIRPFVINDAALLSSDVPETDHPAWSSGTTYSTGNQVILTTTHRRYQSLQNSNLNKNPATEPTFWVDLGPTNRWAPFDKGISTQVAKATSFTYTFQITGRADSIFLANLEAATVLIEFLNPSDVVVWDETYTMTSTAGITDWYSYFFEPIQRRTALAAFNLPTFLSPKVRITVTNTGGTAKLGALVLGQQFIAGRTQYGSSISITDFSRKDKDNFGNFIIVERPFSRKGNFNIMVDNANVDALQTVLETFRSTPIVYAGSECFDSMLIYGFFKDFNIAVQTYSESLCTIEVESLT